MAWQWSGFQMCILLLLLEIVNFMIILMSCENYCPECEDVQYLMVDVRCLFFLFYFYYIMCHVSINSGIVLTQVIRNLGFPLMFFYSLAGNNINVSTAAIPGVTKCGTGAGLSKVFTTLYLIVCLVTRATML